MKKLFLLPLLALSLNAAEADFRKGIDFTGLTEATGAQHNQLVDNATVAAKRGLVIVQTATPDTTTYPRFTNYLWLDINYTPPILKSWSWGVTNWVTATIPANSIGTANIQDGAVTNPKLATNSVNTSQLYDNSVTSDKIVALSITSGKLNNNSVDSTNIIDGTIVHNDIATGGVWTTNILDGSVTGIKIGNGAVGTTNIAGGGVTITNLATNSVGTAQILVNAIVTTNILNQAVTTNKLSVYIPEFYSPTTNAMPSAGAANSYSHGLSGVPTMIRVVLQCNQTENGYSVGDELDVHGIYSTGVVPAFEIATSSTTISLVRYDTSSTIYVLNKSTGAQSTLTTTKWVVKVRAWFQP